MTPTELTLTGTRTDHTTGYHRTVDVRAEIKHPPTRPGEPWLYLIDGVTGHESIDLTVLAEILEANPEAEWLACVGTPGKWDRLAIDNDSVRAATGTPQHRGHATTRTATSATE